MAYVGLGSNLGDRRAQIDTALERLAAIPSTRVDAVSSVYESEPVGGPDQPPFLNAVARLETALDPRTLIWNLQRIETSMGRVRRERWGPRTIDLDLLLFGAELLEEPGLTVPHPELARRAFVLVPLVELDPMLVHPVTGETMVALLTGLGHDPRTVRRERRGEAQ
jgi:2-amino-4-hydroxy-6-hydroxymethyldihydropteridine diphosphokinase